MRYGFIKAAATRKSGSLIVRIMSADGKADEGSRRKRGKAPGFPELCITGYTCSDLFQQRRLLMALERPCAL